MRYPFPLAGFHFFFWANTLSWIATVTYEISICFGCRTLYFNIDGLRDTQFNYKHRGSSMNPAWEKIKDWRLADMIRKVKAPCCFFFKFQLSGRGSLIPEQDFEFVFMPPLMTGMNIPAVDNLLKEFLRCTPIKLELPLKYFDWQDFINLCKSFLKENFYQFIMFLAGGLSAFHYQRVLDVVGRYLHLFFQSPLSW